MVNREKLYKTGGSISIDNRDQVNISLYDTS